MRPDPASLSAANAAVAALEIRTRVRGLREKACMVPTLEPPSFGALNQVARYCFTRQISPTLIVPLVGS